MVVLRMVHVNSDYDARVKVFIRECLYDQIKKIRTGQIVRIFDFAQSRLSGKVGRINYS